MFFKERLCSDIVSLNDYNYYVGFFWIGRHIIIFCIIAMSGNRRFLHDNYLPDKKNRRMKE